MIRHLSQVHHALTDVGKSWVLIVDWDGIYVEDTQLHTLCVFVSLSGEVGLLVH